MQISPRYYYNILIFSPPAIWILGIFIAISSKIGSSFFLLVCAILTFIWGVKSHNIRKKIKCPKCSFRVGSRGDLGFLLPKMVAPKACERCNYDLSIKQDFSIYSES